MLFRDLTGLLFPFTCLNCGCAIASSPLPICFSCLGQFEEADGFELNQKLNQFEIPWSGSFCLWNYHTQAAAELHRLLKYGGKSGYGFHLGKLLATALLNHQEVDVDYILPMPLSRARFLERGYNQAEEICKGIARVLNIPMDLGLLKKGRETRMQTGLNIDDRLENTTGAFVVSSDLVPQDPKLLLVDDVITTGASMAGASRALMDEGYQKIFVTGLCFADHW